MSTTHQEEGAQRYVNTAPVTKKQMTRGKSNPKLRRLVVDQPARQPRRHL